jgi:ABC-2 type transport system ATP-binding protein
MKQKLAFCAALISNPQLLLLDEPCTGVDPLSRAEFWEILNEVRAEAGACIVIATPYCAEAEQCDRVALMNDGRLELCDTPYHLKMQFQLKRIEMHCSDMEQALLSLSKGTEYGEHLYEDLQVLGDRIELLVKDPSRAIAGVNECLTESSVQVHSMQVKELTMENVFFLHLAGSKEPIPGNGSGLQQIRNYANCETLIDADRSRDRGRPARFHESGTSSESVFISAEHLCKMFGSFSAVKDFSLQIKSGEIYGLLGANGAGKTTAIKMLCGLQQASAGAVRICGTAPADLRRANVRKMIGYVSQKNSLYGDLTVLENLEFFASVYELSPQSKREAMEFVEDLYKLGSCKHHLVDTLPSGWKQRVAFAAAIMHKPQVLFLDEPTAGVDPAARRSLWEIIRMLAQEGAAILVTTHILEEAENCNRIGLMLSGELIAEGSPSEIKAKTHAANLEEAFLRIMAKHKRC